MKKIFLFAMTGLSLASCSSDKGKVTIQLPADFTENTLVVSHVTIDNIFTAQRQEDLNVIYDEREQVVRIPNGQYFQGAGDYVLFVKTADDRLERRKVALGESNFYYVEVKSGLQPGEMVVVSDMSNYKNKSKVKIKHNK